MTRPPREWKRLFRLHRWEPEDDVDAELEFHFEARTADLMALGATPNAARTQAAAEFGDTVAVRNTLVAIDRRLAARGQRAGWLDDIALDLRFTLRSLRRTPTFAVAMVLTLALGIGGTAAMFGVVDALLLRPPAMVRDPGRVARVYINQTVPVAGNITTDLVSYSIYTDMRSGLRSFDGLTAYYATTVSEGRGATAAKLRAALTGRNYFDLLGVRAELGRVFADADSASLTPTAVVSDALWRARFGGDPRVIGQTLVIGNRVYTIVGVAARGFVGVDLDAVDIWLPLDVSANDLIAPRYTMIKGAMALSLLARTGAHQSRSGAEAEATAVFRNIYRTLRGADTTAKVIVSPVLRDLGPTPSEQARVSLWLLGVSISVLMLAAVNCANLMLLRALQRAGEFAVRVALGASRARVARLLITESLLVAVASSVVAVAVAAAGSALMSRLLLSGDAQPVPVSLPRLFVFTMLATIVVASVTSLLPLRATSRADFARMLKSGARSGFSTRMRLRTVLLTAQVAIAMLLLVGAGLFTKSLGNIRALDLGFVPSNVLAVNLDFAGMSARPSTSESPDDLFRQIQAAVRSVPGVTSVAVTSSVPFQFTASAPIGIPGRDASTLPKQPAYFIIASEDYLTTIGLRLIDGRWLEASDYGVGADHVVVNQSMAKTYWPGESAVGKCVIAGPLPCHTIVGVVADTRQSKLQEEHRPQLYVPDMSDPRMSARLPHTLVVRSSRGLSIAKGVKAAIVAANPAAPYVTVQPLDDLIAPKIRPWVLGSTMFGLFGALALVLAAVGLYGSVSHSVAERTHEFGVRVALGARSRDIALLALRRVAGVAAVGIAIGVGAALLTGPRVIALLFDISARDAGVFVVAGSSLAVTAVVACWMPLRRAVKIDPNQALRCD